MKDKNMNISVIVIYESLIDRLQSEKLIFSPLKAYEPFSGLLWKCFALIKESNLKTPSTLIWIEPCSSVLPLITYKNNK